MEKVKVTPLFSEFNGVMSKVVKASIDLLKMAGVKENEAIKTLKDNEEYFPLRIHTINVYGEDVLVEVEEIYYTHKHDKDYLVMEYSGGTSYASESESDPDVYNVFSYLVDRFSKQNCMEG